MAFCYPLFVSNRPSIFLNKSSAIIGDKHIPKHHYFSGYSKTRCNIALKQNIHISENRNSKEALHMRHAKALEEVKRVFNKARHNADGGLYIVDSIQRLGIEYHFEEEIKTTLERKYRMLRIHNYQGNNFQEMSEVSLQFRLLRQQGYYIPADIFGKFWDNKGNIKHTYCGDIDGLIALFEASQLSIEGEDCLDKAGEFSRQYLSAWLSRFHDHPQVKVVANTLRCPIHKSMSRFMPTMLQLENAGWTSSLQELSKIDTQIVSSLHLKEILAVSKWWKDLGLTKDLKFARDEPIKWYLWFMACLPDPRLSEERIELTKSLSLIYVIDDLFDFDGNIDALTLFTDAVKRWDLAAMDQLPDHMKVCFKAIYDITNEFAFKTYIKHGWNPTATLIKSWVRLINAFLEEAKWFASGHVPKAEEYLKNGVVSTGVQVVLVHTFFFMGQGITEETVTLMDDFPNLVSTVATILRLCDDLEGDKDINRDGNDGSYMKCYMKEHRGVSIEQTREHINSKISDAWKRLNKECLSPANPLPSSFTKFCLNAARMVPLMYNYDGQSSSKLEEYVNSLFYGDGYIQNVPQEHTTVS
ncbi:(3S,6E)-nerolidol synthase 1-like [Gastrolobium bilobum]|uniref:(3S,6E)-nerolidol synthase 1-like n=1 Tax=Gastrolobium bilobum TaxID=150636 RepID=UPI002AB0858D|nr:(3S,6E)-nerolidol synthase 1-like [Gastrolobium bilobum]